VWAKTILTSLQIVARQVSGVDGVAMSAKHAFGENVDRLITVEMCFSPDFPYGVAAKLYEAARRRFGGPLAMMAAEELMRRIEPESYVLILTGMMIPPWNTAETDGPIGAAALARILRIGFNALPVIVVDPSETTVRAVEAACRGMGVGIVDLGDLGRVSYSASIQTFPLDVEGARRAADRLIGELGPSAVIAVERLGMNVRGEYHTAHGYNCSNWSPRMDYIVERAREVGVLTIGIGDHGNEIGFGAIAEEARKIVPYGEVCRCPCRGGIVCATETDILIVASISNWGAYGVEACLAYLKGDLELMHSPSLELRSIGECVGAGGIDGATSAPTASVDAVPAELNAHLVEMLGFMLRSTRMRFKRHF